MTVENDSLNLATAIEARLAGLKEQMIATDKKLDAVHLSLEKDLSEVKALQAVDAGRISRNELRMAQLQGAGAVLTLALPFVAVGLQSLLGH